MTVARITEIKASSSESFDAAIRDGIDRASKNLEQVKSAWICEQEVILDDAGKIASYRVLMKVTFLLND